MHSVLRAVFALTIIQTLIDKQRDDHTKKLVALCCLLALTSVVRTKDFVLFTSQLLITLSSFPTHSISSYSLHPIPVSFLVHFLLFLLLFLLYLHLLHLFSSAVFSNFLLFTVPVGTVVCSASSVTWWALTYLLTPWSRVLLEKLTSKLCS